MKTKLFLVNIIGKDMMGMNAPLHIATLASYIIEHKILKRGEIKILSSDVDDVLEEVKHCRPSLIGFSVISKFYNNAVELGLKIKKISKAKLLIGGSHISALPMSLSSPFDIGIVGEGEVTLAELVKLFNKKEELLNNNLNSIKGICYKKNNKVVVTQTRPLLPPNKIPIIDYSLIEKYRIIHKEIIVKDNKPQPVLMGSIYSARGCPYHCSFCAAQVIWGSQTGLRFYSIPRVVDEIEFLYKKYNVNCINFLDDTFTVSKERILKLIKELKKRKLLGKIIFESLYARGNLIDKEFVSLLKKLNTTSVLFGIESGSQNILDNLKNKTLTVEQVKNSVLLCADGNIRVIGSFMLFSPNESLKDMDESIKLASWFEKQPNSQRLSFGITIPFPGTKTWRFAIENGYVDPTNINWDRYFVCRTKWKFYEPFFIPKYSKKIQLLKWEEFTFLSKKVYKRQMSLPNYKKYYQEVIKYEKDIVSNHLAKNRIKYRIYRFIDEPVKTFTKLLNHPKKVFKYSVSDYLQSLNKKIV